MTKVLLAVLHAVTLQLIQACSPISANSFVNLPEAKIRGYKPGRFSFNVKGGRCETCGGNGYKTIEMNFLPDVMVPCEVCHGKRYNRETLEVRFKGKSIADVLDMTVNMAVEFFENVPQILPKIKALQGCWFGLYQAWTKFYYPLWR